MASRVATLYGADPVDVARRQLAAEASQTAERFFASLERRTDDGGREWARVSVRDTEDPAEFEVEQVLLVMDERRQWRVVVHGSGLGLPPEDLVPYGLSVEAARRLFP